MVRERKLPGEPGSPNPPRPGTSLEIQQLGGEVGEGGERVRPRGPASGTRSHTPLTRTHAHSACLPQHTPPPPISCLPQCAPPHPHRGPGGGRVGVRPSPVGLKNKRKSYTSIFQSLKKCFKKLYTWVRGWGALSQGGVGGGRAGVGGGERRGGQQPHPSQPAPHPPFQPWSDCLFYLHFHSSLGKSKKFCARAHTHTLRKPEVGAPRASLAKGPLPRPPGDGVGEGRGTQVGWRCGGVRAGCRARCPSHPRLLVELLRACSLGCTTGSAHGLPAPVPGRGTEERGRKALLEAWKHWEGGGAWGGVLRPPPGPAEAEEGLPPGRPLPCARTSEWGGHNAWGAGRGVSRVWTQAWPPRLPAPPGSLGRGLGQGRGAQEHAAPPAGPGEGQTVARDQGVCDRTEGWGGGTVTAGPRPRGPPRRRGPARSHAPRPSRPAPSCPCR